MATVASALEALQQLQSQQAGTPVQPGGDIAVAELKSAVQQMQLHHQQHETQLKQLLEGLSSPSRTATEPPMPVTRSMPAMPSSCVLRWSDLKKLSSSSLTATELLMNVTRSCR